MIRLPVCLLGVGHVHGPGYLGQLMRRQDVEVVGIYDADRAKAISLAARWGVSAFEEVEPGLSAAAAVVVCSEPTRQVALVRTAVEAGLPTLCEKPFGTTLAEAQVLLQLAERVPVSVALPVRYHPAALKLRRAVADGVLGAVSAVWATNRNAFPGGWFADPALAGGGCLLDHVVHVADLLRWVWETEFASVRAEAGVLHTPGLELEDTAIVLAECANGMIATIDPSMSRPRGMPGALDLVMRVWGERGAATVDVFAERIDVVDDRGHGARLDIGYDMDASMIDAWVGAVRDEQPAPVPAGDAFAATSLAFAAQRAAATHRAVALPLSVEGSV
jgi:predicted dehydrogenase